MWAHQTAIKWISTWESESKMTTEAKSPTADLVGYAKAKRYRTRNIHDGLEVPPVRARGKRKSIGYTGATDRCDVIVCYDGYVGVRFRPVIADGTAGECRFLGVLPDVRLGRLSTKSCDMGLFEAEKGAGFVGRHEYLLRILDRLIVNLHQRNRPDAGEGRASSVV